MGYFAQPETKGFEEYDRSCQRFGVEHVCRCDYLPTWSNTMWSFWYPCEKECGVTGITVSLCFPDLEQLMHYIIWTTNAKQSMQWPISQQSFRKREEMIKSVTKDGSNCVTLLKREIYESMFATKPKVLVFFTDILHF